MPCYPAVPPWAALRPLLAVEHASHSSNPDNISRSSSRYEQSEREPTSGGDRRLSRRRSFETTSSKARAHRLARLRSKGLSCDPEEHLQQNTIVAPIAGQQVSPPPGAGRAGPWPGLSYDGKAVASDEHHYHSLTTTTAARVYNPRASSVTWSPTRQGVLVSECEVFV
jgi:hypothetical protein